MVVMQTRDPHAYIYRAFDTMIRGAIQGWQQYDNKQRAQASAGLQYTKMMMDAYNAGGVEAYDAVKNSPGMQEFVEYNDLGNIGQDLEMAASHLAAKEGAAAQQAGVQPGAQQGVTVGGDQLQGRQQAAAAIAGVPAPPPAAAPPAAAPPAAAPPAAGAPPRTPTSRLGLLPGMPDMPPPSFEPSGGLLSRQFMEQEALQDDLVSAERAAALKTAPPAAEAPTATRTEKLKQIVADQPEGFKKKQFDNMRRYLKAHPDLDKLKAKADKIKAKTGAKYDPDKPKKKRWTGKKLTKTQKVILERDRRVDAYLEKAKPAKTVTMGAVEHKADALAQQPLARTEEEVRVDALAGVRSMGMVAAEMPTAVAAPALAPVPLPAPAPIDAPTPTQPPPYSVEGLPQVPEVPEPEIEDLEEVYKKALAQNPSDPMRAAAMRVSADKRNKLKQALYKEELAARNMRFGQEVKVAELAAKGRKDPKVPDYSKVMELVDPAKKWAAYPDASKQKFRADAAIQGFTTEKAVREHYERMRQDKAFDIEQRGRRKRIQSDVSKGAELLRLADREFKANRPGASEKLRKEGYRYLGIAGSPSDLTARERKSLDAATENLGQAHKSLNNAEQALQKATAQRRKWSNVLENIGAPEGSALYLEGKRKVEAAEDDMDKAKDNIEKYNSEVVRLQEKMLRQGESINARVGGGSAPDPADPAAAAAAPAASTALKPGENNKAYVDRLRDLLPGPENRDRRMQLIRQAFPAGGK